MRRWRIPILLLIVLPVYYLVLVVVGTLLYAVIADPGAFPRDTLPELLADPQEWIDIFFTESGAGLIALPALLVAVTQIVFLLPVFRFRRPRARGGPHSLVLTLVAAGLVGGLLTFGLFFALGEAFQFWVDGEALPLDWFSGELDFDTFSNFVMLWMLVVLGWAIWIPVLGIFTRRVPPGKRHARIVYALLGGTVVELIVVIPIDVMVRRRTDCYCGTGTFLALCGSVWAVLWLAGPGVVLALTSRRRRFWSEGACWQCGYERGPTPGPTCPECGAAWLVDSVDS